MYIDTHCHLDDEKFTDVKEEVNKYLAAGVDTVINAGYNLASSENGKKLSEKFPSVYFAVGFHPSDSAYYDDIAEKRLIELAAEKKCVAIGEIGLDYHWDYDKKIQKEIFERQLYLAYKVGLPFCIHSREATKDTFDILKSNKRYIGRGGVMHCFSGSKETCAEYLDLGLYIAFGGTVTFKNSVNVKEAAAFTPTDRILTETDSPYLSPEPKRGRVNSPENVAIVCDYLSALKNADKAEFAEQVKNNAKRLFVKLK